MLRGGAHPSDSESHHAVGPYSGLIGAAEFWLYGLKLPLLPDCPLTAPNTPMNKRKIALSVSFLGALLAIGGIAAIALDRAMIGAPLIIVGLLGLLGLIEYRCHKRHLTAPPPDPVVVVRQSPLIQITVKQ